MKHIITFGFLFASIISCFLLVFTNKSESNQLRQYVELAQKYEKEELYIKAIENYENAISLTENNYEYKLAVIQDYEKLGDTDSAIDLAETVVSTDPEKIDCYYMLLDYYQKNEEYASYIPFLKMAYQNFPEDEKVKEYVDAVDRLYQVDSSYYSDITMFFHDRAITCSPFLDDENREKKRYAVIEGDGSVISSDNIFEDMKFTDQKDNYLVVDAQKGLQIINSEGYPIARNSEVVSGAGIQVQFEGCASVEEDGKQYLLNSELKKSKDSWDFAGTFSNGIAPVRVGDKWGIITMDHISSDSSLCKYEDIKVDEFGRCLNNDRMFVKSSGKYYLMNAEQEKVVETSFEDADIFVSEQPAAVKINGKWGFVSIDGEMVIQPEYEDALSFSNGYAAIKKDGKWGLINRSNKVVVEPGYEQMKYMSTKGLMPVKDESGYWNLLTMYKLYYSEEE